MPFVDRFLAQKYPRDHFDFAALKVSDITSFVRKQATELGSVQAKHMVSSLRAFFRYLRQLGGDHVRLADVKAGAEQQRQQQQRRGRQIRHRGEIDTDLAGCVPCVPAYSFSTIPKFLPAGTVEEILRRTVRSTPHGRRDYAVLILLARLGLRTCEIVRLELEDVDWELGQITVRGKGGRWSKMPLPSDASAKPLLPIYSTIAHAAQAAAYSSVNVQGCKAGAQS